MTKPIWKDSTSYSRSQKERIPTSYRTEVGPLTISVTKGHIYYKGEWYVRCSDLGIESVIGSADLITTEDAQKTALDMCKKRLEAMLKAISLVV